MDWDWQPMKKFSTAVFFFLMNSALGANLILKTKASPVTSSTPSSIPSVVASPTTTLKLSPRARVETQAPVTSPTFIPQSFFSLRSQLLFLNAIDVILAPSISALQAGLALGGCISQYSQPAIYINNLHLMWLEIGKKSSIQ